MSGNIFQPLESFDDLDVSKWNPLLCYLCNEKYEDPCILGCYHSFCCRCVRGRAKEGKINCPLCGSESTIKEGSPPADHLMKFLVESSNQEKEKCANCDSGTEQMFFCNTCCQPLCSICRDETHKAKMFARHEIVVLSKRTKEIHRECSLHHEPYILFSIEKKTMVCINCFRDMKIESRSYCVDLESAYNQGCKKLDHSLQAIRELQHSVRDAILLLRALVEEIKQNSEMEKKAIIDLYDSMQNKIAEKKTELLHEVDSQYDGKEKLFKEQLVTLSTLLPTLHIHLITSAAFSSSANKYEFLDLVYILMERLKSIIHLQHPLHPPHGSQIYTDYRSQFATCLEPLLFPHRNTSALSTIATTAPLPLVTNSPARSDQTTSTSMASLMSPTPGGVAYSFTGNGRRFLNCSMSIVKSADYNSTFIDHCTEFDASHKEITAGVDKLKNCVQELQRDLTLRRCMAKKSSVSDLINSIAKMEDNLDLHYNKVEQKKPLLEKHWEESLQRIATEQEIYQVQLHDVLRLKQESGYLKTILNQLSSFVKSISAVTERIAPKLNMSDKECEHENTMHALFEQINTMQPDSQQRVDAIRTAQEERETTMTANKTNLMDEELIKTKGLLKAPSARNLSRRDSTKRHSKEITESAPVNSDGCTESGKSLSRKDSLKRNSLEIVNRSLTNDECSKSDDNLLKKDTVKCKSKDQIDTDSEKKDEHVQSCCSLSRKDSAKHKSKEMLDTELACKSDIATKSLCKRNSFAEVKIEKSGINMLENDSAKHQSLDMENLDSEKDDKHVIFKDELSGQDGTKKQKEDDGNSEVLAADFADSRNIKSTLVENASRETSSKEKCVNDVEKTDDDPLKCVENSEKSKMCNTDTSDKLEDSSVFLNDHKEDKVKK